MGFSTLASLLVCQGDARCIKVFGRRSSEQKPKHFKVGVLFALGLTFFNLLTSSAAWSLGVGGVENRSFIGEPLFVEVPLYNVRSPYSLKINLERLNGDVAKEGLSASLKRENSQLSIVIQSTEVVNEPYYHFALNLVDEGNEFRKQFTVLLDLPERQSANSNQTALSGPISEKSIETGNSNSVMGPYEWAKEGAIPEKFGAVLDGQSLWRVARRISPAMGVTNNQMMWALYEQNPQAFSSRRIESLKAGSYLDIPSSAVVAGISDSQAKTFLANLSLGVAKQTQQAPAKVASAPLSNHASERATESLVKPNETAALELSDSAKQSFQLSGLEQTVTNKGELVGARDDESRQIITSLSETILSMTEQLGNKDKKIVALEAQVADLKAALKNDNLIAEPAAEPVSGLAAMPALIEQDAGVSGPAQDLAVETQSAWSSVLENRTVWLLVFLGIVLMVLTTMRTRIAALWRSLNLAGEPDQIEFRSVVSEMAESTAASARSDFDLVLPEPNTARTAQVSEMAEPDSISPYSEPFSEAVSDIFIDDETPEEELDFEQRMARAMAENDLEFATQLLEISKGHDVDNERYHFYRLKLLALRHDENAFYDHYYSIEDDLPTFNRTVQTEISKLVVSLARH